jgi:hypothetical protein
VRRTRIASSSGPPKRRPPLAGRRPDHLAAATRRGIFWAAGIDNQFGSSRNYPCVAVNRLAMRVQPHAHRWPCNATCRPPIVYVAAPSTILFTPWPVCGQLTWSPTRAIPRPAIVCVSEAVMTTPPWEVLSPNRMMESAMISFDFRVVRRPCEPARGLSRSCALTSSKPIVEFVNWLTHTHIFCCLPGKSLGDRRARSHPWQNLPGNYGRKCRRIR